MKKLLVIIFVLCLPTIASAQTGFCTRVIDGDTIVVISDNRDIKIRLYGVDCPEATQPYGKEATQFVTNLILNRTIRFKDMGTDRYNRLVAIVYISDTDVTLQEELLNNGLAWIYPLYCIEPICKEWEKVLREAVLYGKGLWPSPPWKWRKNTEKRGISNEK